MSNFFGGLLLLVILLVAWDCYVGRGRFEWTFDGQHHVFVAGQP